jgi:hypothetical protein
MPLDWKDPCPRFATARVHTPRTLPHQPPLHVASDAEFSPITVRWLIPVYVSAKYAQVDPDRRTPPRHAREAHGNVHCTPPDGPKQRQFDGKKHCSADLSAACTTWLGPVPHVQDHLTMLEEQHAQNFKCRLVISPTRTSKCTLPKEKSCLDAPHMCAGGPARSTII